MYYYTTPTIFLRFLQQNNPQGTTTEVQLQGDAGGGFWKRMLSFQTKVSILSQMLDVWYIYLHEMVNVYGKM